MEYAKGIQEAILPSFNALKSVFTNAYLFYRPSNVVSGDFYWVEMVGSKVVLVLADGTGHGVPGAFLIVLGTGLLRQIISEEKICEPDEILTLLNKKVKEGLGQSRLNNTLKDGMDVAVSVWDKASRQLTFSGAKRSMLLKHAEEVKLIKGDRFSIGGDQQHEPDFTVHRFSADEGDSFVFFTDGIVDQFGGPEGKKFLSKRLVELLEKGKGINAFVGDFDRIMTEWLGEQEQLDDMLLLAVEL